MLNLTSALLNGKPFNAALAVRDAKAHDIKLISSIMLQYFIKKLE